MAQVAERLDTYAPRFDALMAGPAAGPDWLRQARQEAFARFQSRGFPTTRDEEWKHTPIGPIASTTFEPVAVQTAIDGASRDALAFVASDLGPSHQLLVVNGRFARDLSSAGPLPQGVSVFELAADRSGEGAAVLAGRFAASDIATTVFVDLNTAFMTDVLVIDVAPGAIVDGLLHVVNVTVGAEPVMSAPRLLVRAGARSQVSIVESFVGLGAARAATLTNAVTQIQAAEGAIVNHVKLQREAPTAFHLASQFLSLERAATVTSCAITLGGRIARNDIIATLAGEGAEVTLDGVYVADGDTLVDTHTTIDHAQPHCPSHEVYKGILSGKSRAVFNGKIIVRQDAQKTDAKQTNKALLLTDDAQINTKPQLEIFADDVKCTHGAAIGQLDDDALFYLRARAISAGDARNMLIHAFAGEVLDRIKADVVSARALQLIDEKLKLV